MFAFFNSILTCVVGAADSKRNVDARSTSLAYIAQRPIPIDEETQATADAVLKALLTSSDSGPKLASQYQSLVGKNDDNNDDFSASGWTEFLARAVFSCLENALKNVLEAGASMGKAMADAYLNVSTIMNEMVHEAVGFAGKHPVCLCALLAVGILVCLAPCAVVALGFGELGPIKGSFAAWWQARFVGYVPKGSLFSFLQRSEMV